MKLKETLVRPFGVGALTTLVTMLVVAILGLSNGWSVTKMEVLSALPLLVISYVIFRSAYSDPNASIWRTVFRKTLTRFPDKSDSSNQMPRGRRFRADYAAALMAPLLTTVILAGLALH